MKVDRCAECTCVEGGIYCNWIAHGDPQVRELLKRNEHLRTLLLEVTNALGSYVDTSVKYKEPYDHPLSAYDRAMTYLKETRP